MKKYYFMNKKELIEADDYESQDGNKTYYYDRDERYSRKRKISENNSTQAIKQRRRKRSKYIYIVDILIILGFLIYWKTCSSNNKNDLSTFIDNKSWAYDLKISSLNKNESKLTIYISNLQTNTTLINKSYNIIFTFIKQNKEILKKESKFDFNKTFKPRDINILTSLTLNNDLLEKANKVKVIINNKFSLYKNLKDYINK